MDPFANRIAYTGLQGQTLGPDYAQTTQLPPMRETVNTALERCGALLNELAIQEQRLAKLAEHVDGPVPESDAKSAVAIHSQAFLVGSVSYLAASLDRLTGKIGAQINRIESALG